MQHGFLGGLQPTIHWPSCFRFSERDPPWFEWRYGSPKAKTTIRVWNEVDSQSGHTCSGGGQRKAVEMITKMSVHPSGIMCWGETWSRLRSLGHPECNVSHSMLFFWLSGIGCRWCSRNRFHRNPIHPPGVPVHNFHLLLYASIWSCWSMYC